MLFQELGIPFMETSAKTGQNVDLAFNALAKYVSILSWLYLNTVGLSTGVEGSCVHILCCISDKSKLKIFCI